MTYLQGIREAWKCRRTRSELQNCKVRSGSSKLVILGDQKLHESYSSNCVLH